LDRIFSLARTRGRCIRTSLPKKGDEGSVRWAKSLDERVLIKRLLRRGEPGSTVPSPLPAKSGLLTREGSLTRLVEAEADQGETDNENAKPD
jgi:hypothetical protein